MSPVRNVGAFSRRVLFLLFALSGASALMYEVLWTRRLTRVFGSTTFAVSTVLAAFMLGLAGGALLLGRWADRHRGRALAAYGVLELAIGVLGLVVPLLLRAVESAYVPLAPLLEAAPTLYFVAQFALSGIVLVLPCALMGGTLPLLARWLVGREDEVGPRVGALYAANTFGACLGTASVNYALLPAAGVRASEVVAVSLNVVAGLGALALARRATSERRESASSPEPEAALSSSPETPEPPPDAGRLLLTIALSGFAAMVTEVTWTRIVGLIFGSSVYAFGLMLLLFLAGIGTGGAVFSSLRGRDPARVLGVALLGAAFAGAAAVGGVPLLPFAYMRGFPAVRGVFLLEQVLQLAATAPLLFPAAVGFGIAFPAAVAATSELRTTGRGVGRITAWNTAGTVGGAFIGGFLLVPRLGLRASLTVAAAASAAAGVLAFTRATPRKLPRSAAIAAAVAVVVVVALPSWPLALLTQGTGFYAAVYGSVEGLRAAAKASELLFYRDGVGTSLSVDRQGPYRFYRSNGKTDASTEPGDMANQVLLGHLPMLLHPAPRDVFVVGLGTGVSAAAVARHPVLSIDIADIEGASRDATTLFRQENRDVLSDPRVRLLVADGRNALLVRDKTYDVIISDPSDVWVAGVGNLFTREFYELARTRLKPGGVMVQWFHTHTLPPDQMKLIGATFRAVFPRASLWRPNRGDAILIGTVEPLPWDLARLRERFESVPGVADDLRSIDVWDPLAVFAAFVLEGDDLDRYLTDVGGSHTDDRPFVEFLSPRAGHRDTATANDAGIQQIQTKMFPPIAGFDPARDLDDRKRYLLGFAFASIGRADPGIALMEESVRGEKPDPAFLVGLANQYRAKGWSEKSMRAYARALSLDPAQAEASLRLADLNRAAGEVEAAEKILRDALRLAPGDAAITGAAARALLDAGRASEALSVLSAALEKAPENSELLLLEGEALAAAGRADDAAAAVRAAAANAPDSAFVQQRAGDALLAHGDLEAARAAYARASVLDPGNVGPLVGMARVAFQRGDVASGREARDAALALDPNDPAALSLPR
jgi:spermidine synthase